MSVIAVAVAGGTATAITCQIAKQQAVLQTVREKLPLMKGGTGYSHFKIMQDMILIVIPGAATENFL